MSRPDPRLDRLAGLIAASPHNLVAASQRARLRSDHIAEAEALADALPLTPGAAWVDLGTGAGLPGLVLALRRPDVGWLLVESRRKKAGAVEAFAAELGLRNVTVAGERAEALTRRVGYRGRYDGVVSRAVGRLDVVAELSRGFLRAGGVVAAVKGPAWEAEATAAAAAMPALGLERLEATAVPSPTRQTWVVTMVATGAVPSTVPRNPGAARRRPLGSLPCADRGDRGDRGG